MSVRDAVLIEGLEVQAHVGVPDEERAQLQKIVLDLTLYLDLKKAGKFDQFVDTVDYAAVTETVIAYLSEHSFHLVEAMAEQIAETLLDRFGLVDAIGIRVRKFSVPGVASVGVSIERKRK